MYCYQLYISREISDKTTLKCEIHARLIPFIFYTFTYFTTYDRSKNVKKKLIEIL